MKITVDRSQPFSFPRRVEKTYGSFIIRNPHEISAKISNFTLDDLEFYDFYGDEMRRASELKKLILSYGQVPLDSYCAKAIYYNKEATDALQMLWFRAKGYLRSFSLETIMFLGDEVARDLSGRTHFSYLKFDRYSDRVSFLPYEDDPGCTRNRDFILVFTKKFLKKLQ